MKNTPLMEKRNQLKKVMTDTFQKEVQSFYNRLNIMQKIQNKY